MSARFHPVDGAWGQHGSYGAVHAYEVVAFIVITVVSAVAFGAGAFCYARSGRRRQPDATTYQIVTVASALVGTWHSVIVGPVGAVGWAMSMAAPNASFACVSEGEPFYGTLATVPANWPTIVGTGIACGFFIFDLINMGWFCKLWKEELKDLFGILWMHHIISMLVWPYCLLVHRSVFFVSWMLATELSNIGQNVFNRAKRLGAPPARQTQLGLLWIVSFFLIRIVPFPFIAYAYGALLIRAGCGYTTFERVLGLVTVWIPLALNAWWFYMMIREALKALRGDAGGAHGVEATAIEVEVADAHARTAPASPASAERATLKADDGGSPAGAS